MPNSTLPADADKHRYAPQLRPPSSFTLPGGLLWDIVERGRYDDLPLRTDLPIGKHPFGVIETVQPLSADDCEHFSLRKV